MIEQVYNWTIQHETEILEILALVVTLSRAIAALTPAKSDDEMVGKFERGCRKFVEIASGAGHKNLIVKPEPVIEPVENILPPADPLAQFENMLDRFGAKIKIVPKE